MFNVFILFVFAHACGRGLPQLLSTFSWLFLNRGVSLNRKLTNLSQLADNKPKHPSLCFPWARITSLSALDARSQTWVLTLTQ